MPRGQSEDKVAANFIGEDSVRDGNQQAWDEFEGAFPSSDDGQLGLDQVVFADRVVGSECNAWVQFLANVLFQYLVEGDRYEIGAKLDQDDEKDAGRQCSQVFAHRTVFRVLVFQVVVVVPGGITCSCTRGPPDP